jgi:hypothetical protein
MRRLILGELTNYSLVRAIPEPLHLENGLGAALMSSYEYQEKPEKRSIHACIIADRVGIMKLHLKGELKEEVDLTTLWALYQSRP